MSEGQQWLFIDTAGQQVGPIAADQLSEYVGAGHITAGTQVWTDGMEEWLLASQVEGLIPAASAQRTPQINLGPQTPATATPPVIPEQKVAPIHQPQINLGPPRPGDLTVGRAAAPVNPYSTPKKKSPVKWIILGIVGLVVAIFAIIIATAPSEEELARTIPGYTELKEANKNLDGGDSAHGNTPQAKKIAADAKKLLADVREKGIEKGITGSGNFSAYCQIKETEGDTTVVIIYRVPKIRKFADDAKKFISDYAWATAKVATMNNLESTENVKLVIAVRGVILYDTMHVGEIRATGAASENPLEGVKQSFTQQDCKTELYPYFAPEKTD